MGVILTFYPLKERMPSEPGDDYHTANLLYGGAARLHTEAKHYEMHSMIYNHEDFADSNYHIGGEAACGQIPSGPLAKILTDYFKEGGGWPDELAAMAYLCALPPDRLVVVVQD